MTTAELIDRWLRDRQRNRCKESTLRVYETRVKTLREQFGKRDCAKLARRELLDWMHAESQFSDGRPKSNDTIRLIKTVLRMIESFGIDQDVLERPWMKPSDWKKPPGRRRERLPTTEETEQILAAAEADFRVIYSALRMTGARPAELTGAQIEQIQKDGRIRTLVLTEHKSDRKGEDRRIFVGEDAAPFFDAAIAGRTEGPIFLRANGHVWTRAAVTSTFRHLRRKLGLPEDLKLYATRHEFITAVTRNHGIATARALAGHSSIQTTQRYDHPDPQDLMNAQKGLYEQDEPDETKTARDVVPLQPLPDATTASGHSGPNGDRRQPGGDQSTDDVSGREAA